MSLSRGSLQCFRKGCKVIGFYVWGPRGSERRYLLYSLGFVGVRELLDFGSLQFRYLSSAPSDCPLGSPLGVWATFPLKTAIITRVLHVSAGMSNATEFQHSPLYACNVQLHQVAA